MTRLQTLSMSCQHRREAEGAAEVGTHTPVSGDNNLIKAWLDLFIFLLIFFYYFPNFNRAGTRARTQRAHVQGLQAQVVRSLPLAPSRARSDARANRHPTSRPARGGAVWR
jgi:hypothetical protein